MSAQHEELVSADGEDGQTQWQPEQETISPMKEEMRAEELRIDEWVGQWEVAMAIKEEELAREKARLVEYQEIFRVSEAEKLALEMTLKDEIQGRQHVEQKIDALQRMLDDVLRDEEHLSEVTQRYEINREISERHDRLQQENYEAAWAVFEEIKRDFTKEMSDLQYQLEATEERIKKKDAANHQRTLENDALRKQSKELDKTLAALGEECSLREAEAQAASQKTILRRKEVEKMEKNFEKLTFQLERRRENRDFLLAKEEEQQGMREELNEVRLKAKTELETAKADRRRTSDVRASDLAQIHQEIEEKREQLRFVKAEADAKEAEETKMLTEVVALEADCLRLEEESNRKQTVVDELRKKTAELLDNLKVVQERTKAVEREDAEAEIRHVERIKLLQDASDTLAMTMSYTEEKMTTAENQLSDKKTEIKKLQIEIRQVKNTKEKRTKKCETARIRIATLEDDVEKLREKLAAVGTEPMKPTTEQKEQKEQISETEKRISVLRKEIKLEEKINSKNKEELIILNKKLRFTQKDLDDLERKISAAAERTAANKRAEKEELENAAVVLEAFSTLQENEKEKDLLASRVTEQSASQPGQSFRVPNRPPPVAPPLVARHSPRAFTRPVSKRAYSISSEESEYVDGSEGGGSPNSLISRAARLGLQTGRSSKASPPQMPADTTTAQTRTAAPSRGRGRGRGGRGAQTRSGGRTKLTEL